MYNRPILLDVEKLYNECDTLKEQLSKCVITWEAWKNSLGLSGLNYPFPRIIGAIDPVMNGAKKTLENFLSSHAAMNVKQPRKHNG